MNPPDPLREYQRRLEQHQHRVVVADSNPLEEVQAIQDVRAVLKGGRPVHGVEAKGPAKWNRRTVSAARLFSA